MSWISRILGRQTPPDHEHAPRIKSRPIMDRVLKEIFVPRLRERGFTGSYPHFRRITPERIDLISFLFPKRGGQLAVELAQCKVDETEGIPPDRMTVADTWAGQRFRLSHGWGWRGKIFVYDSPSYDPPMSSTEEATEASCVKAARLALKAFDEQAEQWWNRDAAGTAQVSRQGQRHPPA